MSRLHLKPGKRLHTFRSAEPWYQIVPCEIVPNEIVPK